MLYRNTACVLVLAAAAASLGTATANAAEDGKYPDWSGQWSRPAIRLPTQPSHDQTKPWGFGQQAPLTPEYQKVLADSVADQAKGGLGNFPTTLGRPAGMPHMMMAFIPLEFVVTPETTYILVGMYDHYRRIFTDGRDWPKEIEPTYAGYSIGRWVDEDGDGKYDVLEVETRGFKGPRAYDEAGLPLHFDNQSIFKERIYLDKADPTIIHDEITTIDHALTRPWMVDKTLRAQRGSASDVARILHQRRQRPDHDRQGKLFPQRRRPADAGQEGSTAPGFAVFQGVAKVMARANASAGRPRINR